MRKLLLLCILLTALISCASLHIKNETRRQGYAKGENILLTFTINQTKNPADSIRVFVMEEKSGYTYPLWAARTNCDKICNYAVTWNSRKPDGEWPMGGRYKVFAMIDKPKPVISDTVEIGLGD